MLDCIKEENIYFFSFLGSFFGQFRFESPAPLFCYRQSKLNQAVVNHDSKDKGRCNHLELGYVCVFEMIKKDDVLLKVSIFRGLS